jgi:hypothetical protein
VLLEYWLVIAIVLAIAEVVAPGIFLIFLAVGAIAAGLAALATPDLRWQLLVFVAASAAAVLALGSLYRRWLLAGRGDAASTVGRGPIGEHGTVVEPIRDGRGKVKVRDTVWLAAGPDLPEGTPIIVDRRDGTLLHVQEHRRGHGGGGGAG